MMRTIQLCQLVALASGLTTPPATPTRFPGAASTASSLGRRAALSTAAAGLFGVVGAASAYDSIPVVEPDFAAMEQARKDRDKVASKKTLDLVKKLKPVEQATNEAEFITAADALALWVIGEGSVPDGIGVKNLVARIRLAYDALPKRSYPCEKTRTNGGVCYSPGKGAELAYEALLKEIRKYTVIQLGDYRRVEFQAF